MKATASGHAIPREVSVMEAIEFLNDRLQEFRYVPQQMPLSSWQVTFGASTAYLVVALLLWLWMRKRQPFSLRIVTLIHNGFMCGASAIMFTGMITSLLGILWRHNGNMEILFCDTNQEEVNRGPLYFWIYMFFLSKYYEWTDTILIILKKNNLSFLHVYHHWITMLLVWVCLETKLPAQWSCESINTGVHIFMYYYYLMSSIKHNVWWKKYITQLQIAQFLLSNALHLTSFAWHYLFHGNCSSFRDSWGNEFGFAVLNSYLLLFVRFYSSTYAKKDKGE